MLGMSANFAHAQKMASAWTKLGDAAYDAQKYDEALKDYQNAVDSDAHDDKAVVKLAYSYGRLERFDDGVQMLKTALGRFADPEPHRKVQRTQSFLYFLWSEAMRAQGKLPDALTHIQQASELAQDADPPQSGLYLMMSGALMMQMGRGEAALDAATQAIVLEKNLGEFALQGKAYLFRAQFHSMMRHLDDAANDDTQALNLAVAHSLPRLKLDALQRLGNVSADQGDLTKALDDYKQAMECALDLGDVKLQASLLMDSAQCNIKQMRYDHAILVYRKAAELSESVHNVPGKAQALSGIGQVYTQLGSFEQALDFHKQAREIYISLKDEQFDLEELGNIGYSEANLGRFPEAITDLNHGLTRARAEKNTDVEQNFLWLLGQTYRHKKDFPQAVACYRASLKIAQATHDVPNQLQSLMPLATAETNEARYDDARQDLNAAITLAKQLGDWNSEGFALNFLAGVEMLSHNRAKAIDLSQQAFLLYSARPATSGEISVLSELTYLYAESAQTYPLAIFYGKQAVALRERIRANTATFDEATRQIVFAQDRDVYRILAEMLVQQGRLPEAQQILHRMKDKEYRDFAERGGSDAAVPGKSVALNAAETEWRDRYAKIADQVTAIGQKREALLARKEQADPAAFTDADQKSLADADRDLVVANTAFQSSLVKMAEEFAKPGASPRLASVGETSGLSETLRNLGPGTVALYTIVEADKYRVIVVTSQTQKAEEYAISSADLNKKILALREALQDPSLDPRPMAQDLYKILIGPIEKDLAGAEAKTLMWSLDGALRYLPIATLYDGKQYLVERYRNEVFTLASQSRLEEATAPHWSALGLGVSKAQPGFEALPAVPEELHGIIQGDASSTGSVLPGSVLLDAAFTRDSMVAALEERKYPVVHIASHFSFRPGGDSESFLLLGDGTHLTLAELKTLPQVFQGTDLLTLSACDTAMSAGDDASGGREIEGCAVIAQRQGARAVLASLWPVADESTQMLMHAFYQYRESHPGASKAQALQAAQLALLHGDQSAPAGAHRGGAPKPINPTHTDPDPAGAPDYTPDPKAPFAHPYFWAPFILIGNWK